MTNQKGSSTLEVILSLILFVLVASALAIAIPMTYNWLTDNDDRLNMARLLEKHLEQLRSIPYEQLRIKDSGIISEGNYNYRIITKLVKNGVNERGDSTWSDIEPAGGNGLTASYYNNSTLTGKAIRRIDPVINFDWGLNSPHPDLGPDYFSVRWDGFIEARFDETYTFYTVSDEGIRLWVNGQLLINNWTGHPATENSGTIALKAGECYPIRIEYFDNTGPAVVKLSWSSPSTPKQIVPKEQLYSELAKKSVVQVIDLLSERNYSGFLLSFPNFSYWAEEPVLDGGLAGLYFNELNFTGTVASRLDPVVDFEWDTNSPIAGIEPNTYSVRWTGFVIPQNTGYYTFYTISDDAVRLWVNHQLLIDDWTNHNRYEDSSSSIYLVANQRYSVTMDYQQAYGTAVAKLLWSGSATAKQIISGINLLPTYSPFEDTYTSKKEPSSNYGNDSNLEVYAHSNHQCNSYLKFYVTGIEGKKIQAVKLRLYAINNGKSHFEIRKTTSPWNESTVSWNTNPAVSSTVYGTYTKDIDRNLFIEVDLDPALLDQGDGIYELALLPIAGNNNVAFYSREHPNQDLGPRLIIDFAEDELPNVNLNILYRCVNTNLTTNTISPWFQIYNNGTEPIDLTKLKLRYWYTADNLLSQNFTCDWSGLEEGYSMLHITNRITSRFVQLDSPVNGADRYVEISFASGTNTLAPGKKVELQNRIYNSSWVNYSQTNDYSFDPGLSNYGVNNRITVYYNNVLIFGTEPK